MRVPVCRRGGLALPRAHRDQGKPGWPNLQRLCQHGAFDQASMHPASTSAAFIRHVAEVAGRHGAEPTALLAGAGIAPAALDDPIARVPMQQLRALLAAGAQATGQPHFGLLVGAAVRPATYSGLGYAAMTSATLGDAMGLIGRFGKIVFDSPSSQTQISAADGLTTVADRRISEIEPYCPHHTVAVLAGWTAFGRWLIGESAPLTEVQMQHAAPADPGPYESFFHCPVRFGAAQNALLFPSPMLQRPVVGADPRMHKSMLLEAEQQMDHSYAALSMKNQLRALLVERLPYGEARLELLAQRLQLPPRTLQRRLAAEGESFSAILDSVRIELARRYLKDSELSIQDIAFTVGFARASAFSHAFRNRYGVSPLDFRKSQHAAGATPGTW